MLFRSICSEKGRLSRSLIFHRNGNMKMWKLYLFIAMLDRGDELEDFLFGEQAFGCTDVPLGAAAMIDASGLDEGVQLDGKGLFAFAVVDPLGVVVYQ